MSGSRRSVTLPDPRERVKTFLFRTFRPNVPAVTVQQGPPSAHRSEFPPVLTTALAAELLQMHAESLRRMVCEGRVPCHRLGGGRDLRFLRDELLAWLADQPGAAVRPPVHAPSGWR